MSKRYGDYIVIRPEIQGGAPIVRGTRTPVRSVVLYYRMLGDKFAVRDALPHLTIEEIDAALSYYHLNSWIVDADIERHERSRDQFLTAR